MAVGIGERSITSQMFISVVTRRKNVVNEVPKRRRPRPNLIAVYWDQPVDCEFRPPAACQRARPAGKRLTVGYEVVLALLQTSRSLVPLER